MKTLEEFKKEFGDELCGLILASFATAHDAGELQHARRGKEMTAQLKRAHALLVRMHSFMADAVQVNGHSNGAHPTQVKR